jgi:glycosyltransferase involved in cell wall biosynthesis
VAERTICTSEAERRELGDVLGEEVGRLVVIHNGVPLPPPSDAAARTAARAALGLGEDDVAVLYMGRLEERKDPLTAARAACDARAGGAPVVLLVAGDGPLAGDVRALAGEAVRPLGHRDDTARLLAAADLALMPSRREGLSMAVLEAMAHGVGVVVSDAPGNPEAVGDAGLVVPAGDVDGFAAALGELACDAARRAGLGAAARERAHREFGIERMLDRTRAVYEAALAGSARP